MIQHPSAKLAFADTAIALSGGALIEYSFLEPPTSLLWSPGSISWLPNSPSITFATAAVPTLPGRTRT